MAAIGCILMTLEPAGFATPIGLLKGPGAAAVPTYVHQPKHLATHEGPTHYEIWKYCQSTSKVHA